jgi:Methyltransferase domain
MHRPKLYLEIGSGISTAFARRAVQDLGLSTRIVSIDPEPRAAIDAMCDEVVRDGLETCDITLFDRLQPGDILFLDGSHRAFMNSDVTVFMIDILPRLKPGVLVHVHDIALPWDYPDMFVDWYWSEAYMLAAYLIGARNRVRPVFPTAWVCRDPHFNDWFAQPPLVDLGSANDGWRGGGSMWFTHVE